MRTYFNILAKIICATLLSTTIVFAETGPWQVIEMSGAVRTAQPSSGVQMISTGNALVAGAVLTTGVDGHVVLSRGEQFITVGPNSRMSLPLSEEPGMTRIMQDLGTLLFKVDKREKQHFRVETPLIAAVVKGTTFTVTADAAGHSVHVVEGAVEVSALKGEVSELVTAGLTAEIFRENPTAIRLSKVSLRREGSNVSGHGRKRLDQKGPKLKLKAAKDARKVAKKAEHEARKVGRDAEKNTHDAAKETAKEAREAAKEAAKASDVSTEAAKEASIVANKVAREVAKEASKITADVAKEAAKNAGETAKLAANEAKESAKEAAEEAKAAAKEAAEEAKAAAKEAANEAKAAAKEAANEAKAAAKEAANEAKAAAK